MQHKHIKIIDFVILAGTLISLLFVIGYARPLVIAPVDEFVTTNSSVLFEFRKADVILIDDNSAFSSPEKIYAKDNLVINLKPGIYYWKVQGALDSEIRQFTINSEVELKLRKSEKEDVYEIVNAGNTRLNVEVYENGSLKENIVLGVDESKESSGTAFVGGMKDE